jgi:hypothetical protein
MPHFGHVTPRPKNRMKKLCLCLSLALLAAPAAHAQTETTQIGNDTITATPSTDPNHFGISLAANAKPIGFISDANAAIFDAVFQTGDGYIAILDYTQGQACPYQFAAIIVNFETNSAPNATGPLQDPPTLTKTFGTCNQPIYEALTGDKVVLKIPEPGDVPGPTGQQLPSTSKFEIDTITSTGLTTKQTSP